MASFEHLDLLAVGDRLRDASFVTPGLMTEVIETACRRFTSAGQIAKTARIGDLIDAQAWTDAALALIELELPFWQIRRIAYDAGEWYCALSRQRELPDWLDQSIEGRHADLAVAILIAFLEAQITVRQPGQPSIPAVPRGVSPGHIPLCCENFA